MSLSLGISLESRDSNAMRVTLRAIADSFDRETLTRSRRNIGKLDRERSMNGPTGTRRFTLRSSSGQSFEFLGRERRPIARDNSADDVDDTSCSVAKHAGDESTLPFRDERERGIS